MLPKIPYSMEKNKSMTVPIGNYNISSNFNPGDIADSYGISARKFPRLTTKKKRELVCAGGEILGMTVFNGEIVTVRADPSADTSGVYVGNQKVHDLQGKTQRKLAPINSKLVVFPDKVYLEKSFKDTGVAIWEAKNLGATVCAEGGQITFTSDTMSISQVSEMLAGYGCNITGKQFLGTLSHEIALDGKYLFYINETENRLWIAEAEEIYHPGVSVRWNISNEKITAEFTGCEEEIYNQIIESDLKGNLFLVNGAELYCVNMTGHKIDETDNVGRVTYYTFTVDFGVVGDSYPERLSGISAYKQIIGENAKFGRLPQSGFVRVTSDNYWRVTGTLTMTENIIEVELDDPDGWGNAIETCTWLTLRFEGWSPVQISKIQENDSLIVEDNAPLIVRRVEMDEYNHSFAIAFEEDSYTYSKPSNEKVYAKMLRGGVNLGHVFKKGDGVAIIGSEWSDDAGDMFSNDTSFIIADIKGNTIYAAADIFTPGDSSTAVTIERKIPNLDFVCEKDNRLYGVNNAEKTVYGSALGDPTNMYVSEGLPTDSFALAVGGEGDFTGCCKYAESVLFFKEDKIYKLTGYTPLDFVISSYDVDGLQAGADRSVAVINEVLYYKGKNGIFAYTGGIPTLISENFGEHVFTDAVAGTDGVSYYVSMVEGEEKYLLSYNTRLGLWMREEEERYVDFVRTPTGLYGADDNGNVYKTNTSDDAADLEWMVQFVPFYETIEGKKTYSRLLMRAELPRGSYMIIEVRIDDGVWCEAGKIVGANKGIIPIRLPIARCDKFEIRLSGKGEFTIHDILREYHVGSEV